MKLKRSMASDPHIPSDPLEDDLKLGVVPMGDGSSILGAGISYDPDDNEYKLEGQIISIKQGSSPIVAGPPGMIGIDFGRMFGGQEESERGEKISLPNIERDLTAQGFEVEYSNGELRITIPSAEAFNPDGNPPEDVYILHPVASDNPFAAMTGVVEDGICLHSESMELEDSNDEENFPRNYQQFSQVFEAVARSFSNTEGIPLPDEQFVVAPPEKLKKALVNLEKKIKGAKRQAGILTGSDLDEEVDKMILKERPDVRFEDVGGLTVVKDELASVVLALKSPELFTNEGTHPPRGVLLYGDPGVGKTLVAKALAREAEADIYVVRIGDVLHSLYGKTERVIQSVFDRAYENGASVIFIDEVDALASHRDKSTEVTSRIVSVLLTNMDGLEDRDKSIIVVGATNRPEAIDTALLRPGRFDLQIEVPLPNESERSDIFSIQMRKANEIAGRQLFEEGFDVNALSRRANHFSGADIAEVVRRTLVKRVRAIAGGSNPGPVNVQDIIEQVERHREFLEKRKQSATPPGQYI